MSKIFFTADNHFNHSNIINYSYRPFKDIEEMNRELISRWNNKVSPQDSVYVLGDFAFDKQGDYVKYLLKVLNGNIFLVRGNHDYYARYTNITKLFGFVKDYYQLKHEGKCFILSHYPIAVWDKKHYGSYHLYGHIHNHPMRYNLGKALNVGVDVNNYEPISIEEVVSSLE